MSFVSVMCPETSFSGSGAGRGAPSFKREPSGREGLCNCYRIQYL